MEAPAIEIGRFLFIYTVKVFRNNTIRILNGALKGEQK